MVLMMIAKCFKEGRHIESFGIFYKIAFRMIYSFSYIIIVFEAKENV